MKCSICNDRGGFRDPFGRWRKCQCMKVTAEDLRLQQLANMAGSKAEAQGKLFDMVKTGESVTARGVERQVVAGSAQNKARNIYAKLSNPGG